MKQFMSRLVQLLPLCLCLFFSELAYAEQAATVIAASPGVTATDTTGTQRPLRRRSAVYIGDQIETGANMKAQLRFTDGTIVSLRENSLYVIEQYQFNQSEATDTNVTQLLKGGLRTITGAISKQNPDAYEVKTPVATLGVRGTDYELVLGEYLVVAVWQGGVFVMNDAGRLDLGLNANYNYAVVQNRLTAPKGLLEAPAEIERPIEIEPDTVSSTTEQQDNSNQNDSPQTAELEHFTPTEATPQSGASLAINTTTSSSKSIDATNVSQTEASLQSIEDEQLLSDIINNLILDCEQTSDGCQNTETVVASITNQPQDPEPDANEPADFRLTNDEALLPKQAALISYSGNTTLARLHNDSQSAPILITTAQPQQATSLSDFLSQTPSSTIRSGELQTGLINNGNTYQWGRWSTGVNTEAGSIYTDPLNPTQMLPLANTLYWLQANPINIATNAYSKASIQSYDFLAGNDHALNEIDQTTSFIDLIIDFEQAQLSGYLQLNTLNQQQWYLALQSNLSNNQPFLTTPFADNSYYQASATATHEPVTGELTSYFFGLQDQPQYAGAYQASLTNDPNQYVHGIFTATPNFTQAVPQDFRLTDTEQNAFSQNLSALLNYQNHSQYAVVNSQDRFAPVFTFKDPQSVLYDSNFFDGTYLHVLRIGDAASNTLNAPTAGNEYWGRWSENSYLYSDALTPDVFNNMLQPSYWLVAPALSSVEFNQLSGTVRYDDYTLLTGHSNTGTISTGSFDLLVDFSQNSLLGALTAQTNSAQNWNLGLEGHFQPNGNIELSLNPYSYLNTSDQLIAGNFSGFIISDSQQIGGSFNAHSINDPSTLLSGIVVSQPSTPNYMSLTLSPEELNATQNTALFYIERENINDTWFAVSRGTANEAVFSAISDVNVVDSIPPLPGDAEFTSTTPDIVIRQGLANTTTAQPIANTNINWGKWTATHLRPFALFSDPNNPEVYTPETGNFYWIEGPLTSLDTINQLSGTLQYNQLLFLQGSSNQSPLLLNNSAIDLMFNFDQQQLYGTMDFNSADNQNWHLALNGYLYNPQLYNSFIDSNQSWVTVNGTNYSVSGDMQNTFMSDSALLAGRFHAEDIQNIDMTGPFEPSYFLDGIFLSAQGQPVTVQNYILSDAETAALADGYINIFSIQSNLNQSGTFQFGQGSVIDPQSPVLTSKYDYFYNSVSLPYDSSFYDGTYQLVLRQGDAAFKPINGNTNGMDIIWGIWDGNTMQPVQQYNAADVFNNYTAIPYPVYWLNAKATPFSTIDTLQTKLYYSNLLMLEGSGADGNITSASIFAMLDLQNLSNYFEGNLVLNTISNQWDLTLYGNLYGQGIEIWIDSYGSKLNGIQETVDGNVDAFLIGDQAQGFAGAFQIFEAQNTNNYLNGLFVAGAGKPSVNTGFTLTSQELSDLNMGYIGYLTHTGSYHNYLIGPMAASPNANNTLFASYSAYGIDDPNWAQTIYSVYRAGSSTLNTLPGNNNGYSVNWGRWDSDSTHPLEVYSNADAPDDFYPEKEPHLWIAGLPSDSNVLAKANFNNLKGTYDQVIMHNGYGNAGPVTQFDLSLNYYFDQMTIFGHSKITTTDNNQWDLSLQGYLNQNYNTLTDSFSAQSYLYIDYANSYINGAANNNIYGELNAFFTGNNADAIFGSYDFAYYDPNLTDEQYVSGIYLTQGKFNDNSIGDFQLNPQEISMLYPYTLGVFAETTGDKLGYHLVSHDINGSPIYTWRPDLDTALNQTGSSIVMDAFDTSVVVRQGQAPEVGLGKHQILPVEWGYWNAAPNNPIAVYDHKYDPSTPSTQTYPMYWLNAQPTDIAVLQNLSGTINYSNLYMMQGATTQGSITNSALNIAVDFSNNAANASLSFSDTNNAAWNAQMSGTLLPNGQQILKMSLDNGTAGIGTLTSGQIEGIFTGPNAEGIGGSFNLKSSSDSAGGIFLITQ